MFEPALNESNGTYSEEEVFVSHIYTKQPWLNKSKLLAFNDRLQSLVGDEKDASEPIEGVRINGRVILTDGNHRCAVAKLRGHHIIKITVLNIS